MDLISRYPTELSGGQKQRICIARALAADPDLIVCDEITSALDPLVARGVLDLLQKLQRERGYAYLFITHDLDTVRRVAHRVAVMLEGRIIAEGTYAAIFSPPAHPYASRLLSSVPELDVRWLDKMLARRSSVVTEQGAVAIAPSAQGLMPVSLDDRDPAHNGPPPASAEIRCAQILQELSRAAARRFGPERAAVLHPALAALAGDIAKIASWPLAADDRPAFTLHERGPCDGGDDASV
jgi:ABC-type dipeptide/oligopeptide/nickel transport system ATPase component